MAQFLPDHASNGKRVFFSNRKFFNYCNYIVLFICFIALSVTSQTDTTDIHYKPIGYGSFEVGQIANGFYKSAGKDPEPISHIWQQRTFTTLGYDVMIKNKLNINISGGGLIAYSTPQIGDAPQTMQTRNFYFLKSAYAAYPIGFGENISLKIKAGYFPYKYNTDARNLGEYLFRSNAYPLLIYSDFDYPQADLLGVLLNFQYTSSYKAFHLCNDLVFNSELYTIPVQNWSLSDVASVDLFQAFTLGAGISMSNWFSVYQGTYGSLWVDKTFFPENLESKRFFYLINGSDTTLFDWRSIKIMTRASFDPKKFIPSEICSFLKFGKNDLKLFGEIDFIGLKNYPQFYTNLKDRTIFSAGINFPGFNYIDLIAGEFEYCPDTTAFSDEYLYGSSTPNIQILPLLPNTIKRSPYRWSVYAKKSILGGHVSFIGQVARDHKKLNFYYFDKGWMSFIETLPTKDDWWWTFKTEFQF